MKEVSNKVSFSDLEKEVLNFWKSQKIFEKSIDQRSKDNEFVFYDGPPFATGLPHYGHLLAGTIKDVIPRYKAMKGHRVERRFGWDCHGLPVELEVGSALGLKDRLEIEEFGVGRFNEECRKIVLRYTNEWRQTVERMGRWVDFDNDYKTMDQSYMESVWWVFKQLWDKQLIYEGKKVVSYSWKVSSVLSNMEADLNYKDVQDPSITVKFSILDAGGHPDVGPPEENTFFLVWTTTPWTLPSNMALCVGGNLDYVKIQDNQSNEIYYLAKNLLFNYFEEGTYQILEECKGTELKGKTYSPLFEFAHDQVDTSNTWKVLVDDYVSDESGTGIVHQAPAFGEDDLRIGLRENLPVFDPVDNEGNFMSFMGFIAGMNIKEADKFIIRYLKEKQLLFKHETIQHSYPFCWRTDTPLIFKAISTWFVKVESFKEEMVQHNQKVHWVPGHIRDGRFGKWLENTRDWAISRNRFWGTPLPIWRSEDGDTICFGSVSELEEAVGQKVDDIHKHFVDDLTFERNGKTYKRIPEVLDCWFESGSMPYAQEHYPFENKAIFEANYPADFICEGLDQTRGWFYSLIVISTALFNKSSFQNVIVNGLIMAEDGKKMSKSLKNFPDPMEMVDKYGADAIRLYMLNSVAVRGDDLKFSEKGLLETTRSILLPLWNALAFLSTYASIDQWQPTPENINVSLKNPLDRWIISKLQGLVETVGTNMDQYELSKSVAPFVGFIDLLTNWYIRRSRRRFWKAGHGPDKQEAYATLYRVLLELSKVIAPFIPFIADKIYQSLKIEGGHPIDQPESVHLADFPTPDLKYRDLALEKKMDLILSTVSMGRGLRSQHQIKIRQPLSEVFLVTRDPEAKNILNDMADLITDELNIKKVIIADNEEDLVNLSAKANFKILGPRFGAKMKLVAQTITQLSPTEIAKLREGETISLNVDGEAFTFTPEEILVQLSEKDGLLVQTEKNLTVALNTKLDEDLIQEGFAREFVNKVQNMRKDQALDVMDRIKVGYQTQSRLQTALEQFESFIKVETLADVVEIVSEQPDRWTTAVESQPTSWDINGENCLIEIRRV